MNFKSTFLILSVILFFSCENNEPSFNADNLLAGVWEKPTFKQDTTIFKRSNSLPNDGFGISFSEDGTFIQRTSGWCGTPPLSFYNTEGSFVVEDDIIKVSIDEFPGNFMWKIISISSNEIVVKKEYSDQEKEHRALMEMYTEISNLAYSVTCTNSSDWKITAYGSKGCGGPQGFLPYSINIDTVSFLEKIEAYTKAEFDYNNKWHIASTCEVVIAPIAVECKNGTPTFVH